MSESTEIHHNINSYLTQVIRIDKNSDSIEFDYICGPIPISDGIGKEIIIRFDSNLTTNGLFFTDSNERQLMNRELNRRKTWNMTITEPIAGNYYPVNSRIGIRDQTQNIQITVLNDRSQGGSSLSNGSIEVMVHRRTLFDDKFGVNEALNETGFDGNGLVIRGKLWLLVSDIESSAERHRELGQQLVMNH